MGLAQNKQKMSPSCPLHQRKHHSTRHKTSNFVAQISMKLVIIINLETYKYWVSENLPMAPCITSKNWTICRKSAVIKTQNLIKKKNQFFVQFNHKSTKKITDRWGLQQKHKLHWRPWWRQSCSSLKRDKLPCNGNFISATNIWNFGRWVLLLSALPGNGLKRVVGQEIEVG